MRFQKIILYKKNRSGFRKSDKSERFFAFCVSLFCVLLGRLQLLAGEKEKIDTTTFSNDMVTFATKDDVLTLLVHLGYLTYDAETKEIWIPNDEVMEQFISTVKVMGWGSVVTALETSEKLLQG